jgi:LysM repeat protein
LYNDYWNLPFFHKKEVEKMVAKRLVRLILIIALLAASFAFTRPVSAGSGCGSTYVVQPGDWLAKIAANCGITLAALYAANPWAAYYYYIYPGQLLTIPGGYSGGGSYSGNSSCGPAYSAYYGNYYVVCYGDTLSGIAWYYGESLAYIQWHNGISNPNLIYSGQFIWP